MAMPPLAFSVHNFISSVGADAGFAAAIGLAVLILLYFVHARETANLREQASLLTQRLQQAEARVLQLTRMQATADAQAASAPAPGAALAPFAPAGTGAPALASATRVVPLAFPAPRPAPVVAAQPAAHQSVAPQQPVVTRQPTPAPAAAPAPAAVPAPAMAMASATARAPAAPGSVADTPPPGSMPAPATDAGGNGAVHPPRTPPPPSVGPNRSSRTAPATRSPVAGRSLPPLELPGRRPRRRLGRGVAVALTALVVVAVAVGLFAVTSIGGTKNSPASQTTNSPSSGHAGAAGAFKPSSVTVAVLNGTAVNQLAHRIADRLAAHGYKDGTIATAANQTQTSTVVAYLRGTKDRQAAVHVARTLGLRSSAVRPVDQSTLQVACPAPSTCTANVVVTVGSDLASR